MRRWWVVGGLLLAACDDGDGAPLPTGHTGTAGDDDDDTVLPFNDDEASVLLLVQQPSAFDPAGSSSLTAVFVETARGWLNLAECFSSFCTNQWPSAPGDSVVVQGPDFTLQDDLLSRNLGPEVSLGRFTAAKQRNGDFIYYYVGAPSAGNLGTQPLGLSFEGGAWDPYTGTADVTPPTAMVVSSPPPTETTEFFSADPIHLAWEPGSKGDVMLLVTTQVERRLYWLEDTGTYDLDLTSLALPDQASVQLDLGRWSLDGVDLDGDVVSLIVKSNQRLDGIWRSIGARDPVTVYDTCAEARAGTPVASGNYFGDFTDFANDFRPSPGQCTPWNAAGQDAVIPIDLREADQLEISYRLTSGDASLYLTTDCTDLGECFTGRDAVLGGGTESITWVNEGADQRVYAVLDAFSTFDSDFTLDVQITSLGGAVLLPTCADAIGQGVIGPGTYQGRLGGNANLLQPACSPLSSGGEGVAQVFLLPGQTLDATATTNGAPNAALYLLYNCSISDSCVPDTVPSKHLQYTNETLGSEFLYLVLDGPPGLDNYVLDIVIY